MIALIDFTATWCKPCQALAPLIDDVEREGLEVRRVDIDVNPACAARYSVRGVPTLVMVQDDGTEIARLHGGITRARLVEFVARHS